MCKYPQIKVRLVGTNGNAYSIMGKVVEALRKGLRNKLTPEEIKNEIDLYRKESMSGDYNHLLTVTMDWINVR